MIRPMLDTTRGRNLTTLKRGQGGTHAMRLMQVMASKCVCRARNDRIPVLPACGRWYRCCRDSSTPKRACSRQGRHTIARYRVRPKRSSVPSGRYAEAEVVELVPAYCRGCPASRLSHGLCCLDNGYIANEIIVLPGA